MKSFRQACVFLAMAFGMASLTLAQGNPRGTSKITLNGQTVSVEYGRPSLKGRSVQQLLSQLKPGDFWRLGADKSTTFTTTADLNFGGTKLPKGVYSLWAQRQSDGTWKLVFNSQHGQWGTNHDSSKDVVSVPLKEEKESKSVQMVTISLEKEHGGGEISINWGNMELSTNFTVAS
jgi:hypothetical protein